MAFRTYCDQKGCRKEMQPVIDKETDKVYCTECSNEINTVSEFMKRQMVSMGQVRRDSRKKAPYSVTCESCGKQGPPKTNQDDVIVCSFCDSELKNLSAPFIQMLKTVLKNK